MLLRPLTFPALASDAELSQGTGSVLLREGAHNYFESLPHYPSMPFTQSLGHLLRSPGLSLRGYTSLTHALAAREEEQVIFPFARFALEMEMKNGISFPGPHYWNTNWR